MNNLMYNNIKILAEKEDIAMGELETRVAGVSQGYLSRLHRNGKMLDMPISVGIGIASALGTTLEGLMTVDYCEIARVEEAHRKIHEYEREIEKLKETLNGVA